MDIFLFIARYFDKEIGLSYQMYFYACFGVLAWNGPPKETHRKDNNCRKSQYSSSIQTLVENKNHLHVRGKLAFLVYA